MEEHHDALLDLNDKLQQLMFELKAVLPSEDGIILRPQVRKKLKLSRQKQSSKAISSLPLPSKRGRRKQDAAYRNRVGKRAHALRKVCTCVYVCKSKRVVNMGCIHIILCARVTQNVQGFSQMV